MEAPTGDYVNHVWGRSPIHDDYPVSGLYEQQKQMQKELSELKTRLKALGVEV